jgi:hypothetical protein
VSTTPTISEETTPTTLADTMPIGQGTGHTLRPVAEWIGDIRFDPEVERKIRKRGLTPDQVREAVAFGADEGTRWDDDDRYGRRLIARGTDAQGPIEAYLRPIDEPDGLWECLTAWRL